MRRRRIPTQFYLFGHRWVVHIMDPMADPELITHSEAKYYLHRGMHIAGLTVSDSSGRRTIYIHPDYKYDWENFAHELEHAMFAEMGDHQKEKGWKREPIKHSAIEKIAIPLGRFLEENLSESARSTPSRQRKARARCGRRRARR